jgi:hypothetical protein
MHADLPILITARDRRAEIDARFAADRRLATLPRPYKAGALQDALRELGVGSAAAKG